MTDKTIKIKIFQKETPSDVQLHLAALRGDEIVLKRVLDSGKVHVDCKDEVSLKHIYTKINYYILNK